MIVIPRDATKISRSVYTDLLFRVIVVNLSIYCITEGCNYVNNTLDNGKYDSFSSQTIE